MISHPDPYRGETVKAVISLQFEYMGKVSEEDIIHTGQNSLMESVRLRVKDVDFGQGKIFIRNSEGGKDRTVILPDSIQQELQAQIQHAADS